MYICIYTHTDTYIYIYIYVYMLVWQDVAGINAFYLLPNQGRMIDKHLLKVKTSENLNTSKKFV